MALTIAFSPCPNDTFMFHAWVHGMVAPEIPVEAVYADIQQLNEWALDGRYAVTKASIAIMEKVKEDYTLLPVGCALGSGCGPKIVAKKPFRLQDIGFKVLAVPGENTTANRMLDLLVEKPRKKVFCRYDAIVQQVVDGEVDAGIIIHETRFTFAQHGLVDIVDLGTLWEKKFQLPIPLGGVFAKRSLGDKILQEVACALRASLEYARAHPRASEKYVLHHSQEKDPAVVQKHIDTYVTQETLALSEQGQQAIQMMCM